MILQAFSNLSSSVILKTYPASTITGLIISCNGRLGFGTSARIEIPEKELGREASFLALYETW